MGMKLQERLNKSWYNVEQRRMALEAALLVPPGTYGERSERKFDEALKEWRKPCVADFARSPQNRH